MLQPAPISATPADTELQFPRRAVAIGAVLASMTAVVIDAGLSNVALPSIAASLDVTPSDAVRVVTAYQTALIMALLPCAALAERFGHRRVFASGVGLFAAASAMSALAPSLGWLVAARFVQGLGGAAILALGVALLRFSVSDRRLGAAISWNALTVALSGAAGPALGALLLSLANWPWIYAVNVPICVAVLAATRALPPAGGSMTRLDLVSIALSSAMFATTVAAMERMVSARVEALALLAAAAAILFVLVRRESSKPTPYFPLDLLRDDGFRTSVLASIACFAGQTAGLVALPFFLQHGLHQSAAAAALYMMTWPLGVAAAAALAGRMANFMATAWLCTIGGVLLTGSLSAIATWPWQGDPQPLILFTALGGAGFGLFQVGNNRALFLSAPRARSAAAGAMQGTARVAGQTVGALLAALLFAAAPMDTAPQTVMCVGAALTLLSAGISLFRLAQ